VLLIVGLGSGALGGACLWAIPNIAIRSYAAGLLTATIVGFLAHQVTQMAGTSGAAMGEIAEQWTAQELRKLRRQGWRVVNHLMLRVWDIDHVLVGPGGVYAVETKWSAQPWELNPPDARITSAVRQAKSNARDLSLWQPIKAVGAVPARAVVVLWGGMADAMRVDAPVFIDDVVVVTGRMLDGWRTSLPEAGLTDEQVEACWRAIEAQARIRDAREGPPPDSIWTIVVRYLAVFAASLISFVVVADLLPAMHSYAWWLVVYGATFGVGIASLRIRVLRPYALGWIAGIAVSVVVAIVIIVGRAA
jgi:hypothetical protein